MADEIHTGIWLEVAEVRFETGKSMGCQVQLKGDKERPEPVWWPVEAIKPNAANPNDAQFETFKTITEQVDKKKVVLARLSCKKGNVHPLRCSAFRFQSPELGSR